ncbi:MAG: chromate efflux transporter [Terriglobia bacterium]|jgi:chromate transporter
MPNSSQPETPVSAGTERSATLKEVAWLFLRLGTTAFGGPAAHAAIMEDEFVRRRGWLTREKFLDLLGAANLIPGPSSTEMAIYIGYQRAGWRGLLLGGVCFIVPAMLLVLAIAWAYVRYGRLPQVSGVLYGVKPVIIAVVLQAILGLGRIAVKTRFLALIGLLAALLAISNLNILIILVGAGTMLALGRWLRQEGPRSAKPLAILLALALAVMVVELVPTMRSGPAVAFGLGPLFLYFVKIGSVLYGGGYVLLAFLRTDLVARWHWLTSAQLLDAVAVGQVTPGPLFTTATFIGYLLGGPLGALIATVGIFMPAFFFAAISGSLVPRIRRSAIAGAFLDGVNVASLALMAVVTVQLGRAAIVDLLTLALAAASALLLLRFRVNSAWLVLGGGLIGFFVQAAHAGIQ